MSDLDRKIHELEARVDAIEERLAPPDTMTTAALPADMWDSYGVRWTPTGWQGDEVLWRSGTSVLRTSSELEERGPFTLEGPLAEDPAAEYVKGYEARNAAAWERGKETDDELLARLGTDAEKWAEEFVSMFRASVVSRAPGSVDEGVMIGWFANAIEAGRSAGLVDENGIDWKMRATAAETELALARLPDVEPEKMWAEIPLDTVIRPDATIRLTIVGPAADGWDGSRPTEFVWDDDYDVTVEIHTGDMPELPHDDESVTPRPDEEDDVDHYFNATVRMRERAEAAEGRLRLAKDALMSSGYFDEGQVDDEIAPRIHELIAAHNEGFCIAMADADRLVNKWKDRAETAEARVAALTEEADNLRRDLAGRTARPRDWEAFVTHLHHARQRTRVSTEELARDVITYLDTHG